MLFGTLAKLDSFLLIRSRFISHEDQYKVVSDKSPRTVSGGVGRRMVSGGVGRRTVTRPVKKCHKT